MLIKPNSVTTQTVKSVNKKILDETLASKLSGSIDCDGVTMTVAQAISNRLVDIALFAESNKDATTAARLIFERVNGKPAVIQEEEKVEIPTVAFRLKTKDFDKLKQLSDSPTPVEAEPSDKITVSIDGEPDMEF